MAAFDPVEIFGAIRTEYEKLYKPYEGAPTYSAAYDTAARSSGAWMSAVRKIFRERGLDSLALDLSELDPTIGEALRRMSGEVARICFDAQSAIYEAAKVGIKPIGTGPADYRIRGLLEKLAEKFDTAEDQQKNFDDFTGAPAENVAMAVVDESVRTNATFAAKAGLETNITRTLHPNENTCPFCRERAGNYTYPFSGEIFRRHDRCRCTVNTSLSGRMTAAGHGFVAR